MNIIIVIILVLCGLYLFVDGLLSICLQLDDLAIYQPGRIGRIIIGVFLICFSEDIVLISVIIWSGVVITDMLFDIIKEYEAMKIENSKTTN